MRGYHSVKDKAEGHEKGLLPTSYYYVTLPNKFATHKYAKLHGAFFNREFPTVRCFAVIACCLEGGVSHTATFFGSRAGGILTKALETYQTFYSNNTDSIDCSIYIEEHEHFEFHR